MGTERFFTYGTCEFSFFIAMVANALCKRSKPENVPDLLLWPKYSKSALNSEGIQLRLLPFTFCWQPWRHVRVGTFASRPRFSARESGQESFWQSAFLSDSTRVKNQMGGTLGLNQKGLSYWYRTFFYLRHLRIFFFYSYGCQRSCIWLVACKLSIFFRLSTSRIFKFFLLPFFINKPNLKIWRTYKYALASIKQLISYELYTLLPHVFIHICILSVFHFRDLYP